MPGSSAGQRLRMRAEIYRSTCVSVVISVFCVTRGPMARSKVPHPPNRCRQMAQLLSNCCKWLFVVVVLVGAMTCVVWSIAVKLEESRLERFQAKFQTCEYTKRNLESQLNHIRAKCEDTETDLESQLQQSQANVEKCSNAKSKSEIEAATCGRKLEEEQRWRSSYNDDVCLAFFAGLSIVSVLWCCWPQKNV